MSPSMIGGAHRTDDRGRNGTTKHHISYHNYGYSYRVLFPLLCFRIITVMQTRDPLIIDSISAKMHSRYNRMPSLAKFMWDHESP